MPEIHGYALQPDHIVLNTQEDEIKLNRGYTVRILIINDLTSSGQLKYGINDAAKASLAPGQSHSHTEVQVCGAPTYFDGYIKYKFDDATSTGSIIITRVVTKAKKLA